MKLFYILFLFPLICALPLDFNSTFEINAKTYNWSKSVYKEFLEIANWARISYCTVLNPKFTTGIVSESCPKMKFCQSLNDETKIIEIFRPSIKRKEISGTAFVAVNDIDKKVYVVFRGSISVGDWTTDVLFKQCQYVPILKNNYFNDDEEDLEIKINKLSEDENEEVYEDCPDCKVHCGVYVEYSKLIARIDKEIKPYMEEGYQLIVTGHSLGGGYTYLAGLEFLLAGYNPLVISYSSLRIGNPSWNEFVDEKFNTKKNKKIVENYGDLPIPSYTRVYQKTDLVPRLPPNLKFLKSTYTHSGLEFVIDSLSLPQTKDDIEFRGKSDNFHNEPFEFELSDIRAATEAYQHINTLVRMSPPCNEFQIPFL